MNPPSDIALARLETLLESTNALYQSGKMVLESDLTNSYHEALNVFFDSLDGSILGSIMKIYAGSPADPLQYNTFTTAMQKDVEAVYAELGAIDRMVSSSFNSLVAERDQGLEISKRISNKLGDYLLYADSTLGGGFFYGDSFNTADRLQIGSTLVSGGECFHSPDEGIILLPLEGEPERPTMKSITINSPSNGIAGSNYQIDVFGHDEIQAIGDSQPNTWFEYEKVTVKETNVPLTLDLTITLDQLVVMNHININPINFGTPSPVRIVTIETSKDGKEYTSIKDEIPLKDFVSEDEKEEFNLSPSASKYSGQGFYSFLPRKVQYIHISLQQHSPYVIETLNGLRLRYAIGIRDINLLSRKFKTEGSIVSTPFTSSSEIRKVSLWASENPSDVSTLSDISHFISHDDGATWVQVQPQGRDTFGVPEVINYNNISDNSISTSIPVKTLRHKISMTRDKKAFDGNVTLKQERIPKVEIVNAPVGTSSESFVTETPIKETVRILMPFVGSFSCPRANDSAYVGQSPPMDLDFVEFNVDASGVDTRSDGLITGSLRYPLPYRDIPNLEQKLRVFINGSQILYSAQDADSLALLNEISRVFFLNKGGTELQFGKPGYGTDISDTTLDKQYGFIPASGSKVQVCLDGDNPTLRLTDRGYVMTLAAPSDGFKETVSIVAIPNLQSYESFTFDIPKGAFVYKKPGLTSNSFGKLSSAVSSNNIKAASKSSVVTLGPMKTLTTRKDVIVPWQEAEDTSSETGTHIGQGQDGMLPPIYSMDPDDFTIEERYLVDGSQVPTAQKQFTDNVTFVDGVTELVNNENAYTFDPYTGTVYLGSAASKDRTTTLICKKVKATIITEDMWEFDKNIVTGRIDTRKIVLDPRVVYTVKQEKSHTASSDNSITLIDTNEKPHSWFNKSVVRGTVKVSSGIFSPGVQATEVPFVDGKTELTNVINVSDELVSLSSAGTSLWSCTLSEIFTGRTLSSEPSFSPVRSTSSATSLDSQFSITGRVDDLTDLTTDGQWHVDITTGVLTLFLTSIPIQHTVSYQYDADDSGVDLSGLYSIDYYNGIIHFSDTPINGTISFEVSCYSAFYNIGKVVSDGDIESIDPATKKITFGAAFGMQFLKQNVANKARPQVLKILYDCYKKSTESLKDLEPYFSPICKDVAFKSVTINELEEL
jgi:hypothetical protein